MGRDRAVIDDPSPARVLVLHDLERLLGTQKGTGQIRIDHALPLLVGQVFEGNRRRTAARIIKQQIQPTERLAGFGEQRAHRSRVAHIGRHDQGPRRGNVSSFRIKTVDTLPLFPGGSGFGHGLLQQLGPTAGQHDRIALLQQGERQVFADTRSGSRHQRDSLMCRHDLPSCIS